MTIEPEAATTVSRRPLVGADKPRTLADYQAPIIARFGFMPSWPEMAEREGPKPSHHNEARPVIFSAEGRENIRKANIRMAADTDDQIASALGSGETTAMDISTTTGRANSVVRRSLYRLLDAKRVQRSKVKGVMVWRLTPMATE